VEEKHIEILKFKDGKEKLWPLLDGQIFHYTTSLENKDLILESGSIKHNKDERFEFSHSQSKNCYGKNRGYISVFNLSEVDEEKLGAPLCDWVTERLPFLTYPVYFIFKDKIKEILISSEQVKIDGAIGMMHIPYVENWVDNEISTDFIEKIIIVNGGKARKKKL